MTIAIQAIQFTPYSVSGPNAAERRGVFVRADCTGGLIGQCEIAPLPQPGFSRESLEQATGQFSEISGKLKTSRLQISDSEDLQEQLKRICRGASPSVIWAVEMLLADLASQQAGVPLAQWLTGAQPIAAELPVNGLLNLRTADVSEQLDAALSQGFKVYKIKIAAADIEEQVGAIRSLQKRMPAEIKLRLDCNRGFALSAALRLVGALSGLNCIEYIEEPLAEPELAAYKKLRAACEIPLALDESVGLEPDFCRACLQEGACDVLILKPLIQGGVTACWDWIRCGREINSGMQVVLTSTMEVGPGFAAGVHAALATDVRFGVLPCGFDTLKVFEQRLMDFDFSITAGKMRVPSVPGLGINVS